LVPFSIAASSIAAFFKTEVVTTVEMATTILRWYSYRWRVEDYHKILKSGTQVERYRLAADGMKTLLG